MHNGEKPKVWGRWKEVGTIDVRPEPLYQVVSTEGEPIRILKQVNVKSEKYRVRFCNEVRAQRELAPKCPYILEILDDNLDKVKNNETDLGYYVMPYAKLGDLNSGVSIYKDQYELSLKTFLKICQAVLSAHQNNPKIIHRDIKPRNILLMNDQTDVKVADFGICYIIEDFSDQERITAFFESVGPRHFIAPELEKGRCEDVDERCDIYSLGKLLHYMLCGGEVYVFREQFMESKINLVTLLNNNRYSVINEKLFNKMICENPDQRFNSLKEIIYVIDNLLTALLL